MKKLALFFSLSLFSLSSIFAQETFTYKNVDIVNDSRKQADQALCVNKAGLMVQSQHSSDGQLYFRTYDDPTWKTFKNNSFTTPAEPHDLIALKNGGYASAGRNSFLITNADEGLTVLKSIGSKMLDWRVESQCPNDYSTFMDTWKKNDAGSTGTAVDFIELAESPDGNYVCALFLYHVWGDNCEQTMKLGIAVSDLTNGGKMSIGNLGIEVSTSFTPYSAADVSPLLHLACIDNQHVVIGCNVLTEDKEYQLTVVNFKKIIEGAFETQVWQGILHSFESPAVVGGLFAENGTLYYAISDGERGDYTILGKAKWDGTKLVVVQSKKYETGHAYIHNPQLISNFSNEYFIVAGSSASDLSDYSLRPYFLKIKKSDLGINKYSVIKGDNYFQPLILDVAPLADSKLAVLFRGKAEDGGSFYLGTLQFND